MSQILVTGEAKIRDIQGPVVANSGVITALDGAASQYVRGDGTLADFPTSSGGGSSVSYYLNSSVSQGTIGGVAYRELSKEPIIGAGTDIAIAANGYVASYLTDANDPDVLSIPGGNFNCEFYFSVNNNTGNPFFYAELYKYDGTTFTLLGSSVGVPEYINQGTIIAPYYFAIPVPTSALALTDRLAIRIYVNVDGRTVTLHTENSHLCQVVTTLSKGMVSLNNLTDQSQYLTTGTSGTDFNIVSSGDTHTFNLPIASATNTGKLSSTDWSTFNNKQAALSFTAPLVNTSNTISIPAATSLVDGYLDNLDWTNFNTAYNNMIVSAAVTGTTTKTLTLTQQDAGTITASWTDDNTDAVTSVFGRTGAVVAQSGDYNTSQVTENTNLYFTDARARAALSFTAGSGAYNSTTGVITIPTNNNQITNGSNFITLTSLSAGTGISYNNTTGVITNSAPDQTVSLTAGAGISISGSYPSFTIASTITQYTDALARAAISLTTTGTSGAATYNSTTGVLNVPQYQSVLTNPVTGTGTTNYLPKFTGASTIGNSIVYDNGSFIGINTTTNGGILSINGTDPLIGFQNSGSTKWQVGLENTASDRFVWYNNVGAAYRMILTASGNLGLGVTPSAWGTNFKAIQLSSVSSLSGYQGNFTLLGTNFYYDSGETPRYLSNASALLYRQGTDTHIWFNAPSGTAGNAISFTQAMTLFSTGNLAVGTTTDAGYKLDVNGTGRFSGAVTIGAGSSATSQLDITSNASANAITLRNRTGDDYAFFNWRTFGGGELLAEQYIQRTAANTAVMRYTIANANATPALYLTIASTGAATFSSSVTATKIITTGGNGAEIFNASTATTGSNYFNIRNTGAILFFGIESSTGGSLQTGASAYASVLTTGNATDLSLGTGQVERMVIKATTGNVGIGTSSPAVKFEVAGSGSIGYFRNPSSTAATTFITVVNANNTSNGLVMAHISDGTGYFGTQNSADLRLVTADSEKMRITSGGNVLIGTTTNAGYKLDVSGTSYFRGLLSVNTGSAGTLCNISDGIAQTFRITTTSTGIDISNPNEGYISFTNASERMRITSGGNVGIGTSSPQRILSVYNTNAATIYQTPTSGTGTNDGFYVGQVSDVSYVWNYNSFPLVFGTAATERMRITSGGKVNINNTSNTNYQLYVDGGSSSAFAAYSTSPNNQFKLAGTAPGLTINNTITSPTIGGALGACTSANDFITGTAAGDMILINQFTGNKLYITNYSGGVYLTQGATSWTANSDIRIKNINSNITNAVEKLSTLQTINFCYKDDISKKENLGLIAQEVEMVFPELIETNNDGILGVRYTELIPVLIEAIKEQQEQIKELKLELDKIKNK